MSFEITSVNKLENKDLTCIVCNKIILSTDFYHKCSYRTQDKYIVISGKYSYNNGSNP